MSFRGSLLMFPVLLLLAAGPAAWAAEPYLRYDPTRDNMTVQATDASLTLVLSEMARLSGLDIRMDPAVERKVQVDVRDQPLETAIARVTGKLNTIKGYRSAGKADKAGKAVKGDKKEAPLLVSVTILPEGNTDASRARSVLDAGREGDMRAVIKARREQKADPGKAMRDRTQERWQERLAGMSEADRKKYEQKLAAARDREAKAAASRREKEAKREVMRQRAETARAEREKGEPARKPHDPEKAKRAAAQFPQP